ncbi:hypothetical protein HY993_05025 [Candidatus Micrarchaeota archaeon]|nr:hypothetical protein [Candidatus Micrarchaeota archaeon]
MPLKPFSIPHAEKALLNYAQSHAEGKNIRVSAITHKWGKNHSFLKVSTENIDHPQVRKMTLTADIEDGGEKPSILVRHFKLETHAFIDTIATLELPRPQGRQKFFYDPQEHQVKPSRFFQRELKGILREGRKIIGIADGNPEADLFSTGESQAAQHIGFLSDNKIYVRSPAEILDVLDRLMFIPKKKMH